VPEATRTFVISDSTALRRRRQLHEFGFISSFRVGRCSDDKGSSSVEGQADKEMILIVGRQETIKAGMFTCIVTTNTLHFNIGTTVSCVSYCVLRPSSNLSVGC